MADSDISLISQVNLIIVAVVIARGDVDRILAMAHDPRPKEVDGVGAQTNDHDPLLLGPQFLQLLVRVGIDLNPVPILQDRAHGMAISHQPVLIGQPSLLRCLSANNVLIATRQRQQ